MKLTFSDLICRHKMVQLKTKPPFEDKEINDTINNGVFLKCRPLWCRRIRCLDIPRIPLCVSSFSRDLITCDSGARKTGTHSFRWRNVAMHAFLWCAFLCFVFVSFSATRIISPAKCFPAIQRQNDVKFAKWRRVDVKLQRHDADSWHDVDCLQNVLEHVWGWGQGWFCVLGFWPALGEVPNTLWLILALCFLFLFGINSLDHFFFGWRNLKPDSWCLWHFFKSDVWVLIPNPVSFSPEMCIVFTLRKADCCCRCRWWLGTLPPHHPPTPCHTTPKHKKKKKKKERKNLSTFRF